MSGKSQAGVVTSEGSASGIQKSVGTAPLVQPATGTSEVDQVVEIKELGNVAKAIENFWDEFAVELDPVLFQATGKIQAIKNTKDFSTPIMQAQAMLEMWRDAKDKDATRRLLIKTLCKMGKVKQSNDIFGEILTGSVWQHKTDVIDGPLPPDKQTDPVMANPGPGNGTASVKAKATPTVAGNQIDVLIVTATDKEYEAITEFLHNVSGQKQLEDNPLPYRGGHELGCRVARWNPGKGRSPMIVGVVQQTEQGQRGTDEIVSIIKDAVERKRIAKNGLVAMIGMCAGNEKLVRLGDVLVPWEISALKVLGKKSGDGYEPRAILASLPAGLRTDIQRAAQNANTALKIKSGQKQGTWLDSVPDKFRGTEPSSRDVPSRYLYTVPSPKYLYDVTLFELQQYPSKEKANKCSIGELHKHIMEQYKWPELINKKILNEALEHSESLEYIDVDTSQHKKQFSVNSQGQGYLEKMSDEDEFPRADRDPEIHWGVPVIMGNYVDKSLSSDEAWKKLARDACQVKAYGYEMEGYAFLDGMRGVGCETLTPLFIKTVADFGTKEYKMKDRYYQGYATTVAAAFLFHFLTDCPPESYQPKTVA